MFTRVSTLSVFAPDATTAHVQTRFLNNPLRYFIYVVCAMIQVVSRQSIITVVSVRSQASTLVICEGKSVSEYFGLIMSVSFHHLFSILSTIFFPK